jgi:hypothetical protein
MSKEEITLTDEERETAKRLWKEADKAQHELHQLLRKAINRHSVSSGSKPVSFAALPIEKPIRECDENGQNCYCWQRDKNGVPGPIRPC